MDKPTGSVNAPTLFHSPDACGGQPAADSMEAAVAEILKSAPDTKSMGEVPDYSRKDCWLSFPEITRDVDTFYYYNNIKDNAAKRIAAYQAKNG